MNRCQHQMSSSRSPFLAMSTLGITWSILILLSISKELNGQISIFDTIATAPWTLRILRVHRTWWVFSVSDLDHQKSRLEPSWRAEASLRWTRTQVSRECRLEFRSCESRFATVCHFEGVMSTIPVLFVCILLFPPGMITNRISLKSLVLATFSRPCVKGKQKLLPQRIIQVLQRHQVTPGLPWRLFCTSSFWTSSKVFVSKLNHWWRWFCIDICFESLPVAAAKITLSGFLRGLARTARCCPSRHLVKGDSNISNAKITKSNKPELCDQMHLY